MQAFTLNWDMDVTISEQSELPALRVGNVTREIGFP